MTERDTSGYIAIIGMDGRFPGAQNLDEFWSNLSSGLDVTRELTDEELLITGESRAKIHHPNYVRRCAFLDDADKFDARFFGIAPRDAAVMDPQHRLFLEVAWGALEDAGYDASRVPGPVGVFAGSGMSYYDKFNVSTHKKLVTEMGEWLVRHTANDRNFLATLVSYKLNITGPSMNIQTACSSALVATHVACQSLLNGECDLAIAGGSTINHPQRGYVYEESEILSKDGRCRAFDAKSSGTVFGSGAGAVVLRRLQDAIDAGDPIDAVICGSAINNDGANKVGFLAPSVSGQTDVIVQALQVAQVDPATINYVETHGTGTLVGDPIEVTALRQAFVNQGYRSVQGEPTCGLGSAKTNIGHLGEAAGIAGLIKLCLSLRNQELPASLHFESPNPELGLEKSPFYIVAKKAAWPRGATVRRAGITGLGAGGTNAHLIIEDAPPEPEKTEDAFEELLVLSAKSPAALEKTSLRLADHLSSHPELALKDVAHTLREGRMQFPYRRAVFVEAEGVDGLREAVRLLADVSGLGATRPAFESPPRLAFLFPGGGAQYSNMGRELYESEDVYRAAIDECAEHALALLQVDIRKLMYCDAEDEAAVGKQLASPRLSLPTLFSTSYAIAQLLLSFGLEPDAMLGHSLGEYVAACLAGVFSVRDALALVIERGRLFGLVEEGGMLALPMSSEDATAFMGPDLSFAAINAPNLCVASGPVGSIDRLEEEMKTRQVECTRVHIRVAAHSSLLEPVLPAFRSFCEKIDFQPPTRRFVSNLTGDWARAEDVVKPEYWVKHLRSTVQFSKGLTTVLAEGDTVLLEVGPGRTLVSVARQHARSGQLPPPAFPTLRHPKETVFDRAFLYGTIGKWWALGGRLDFEKCLLPTENPRRVHLPTYPFEHESYFLHPQKADGESTTDLVKREDVGKWFHLPTWTKVPLFVSDAQRKESRQWLIFTDQVGVHGRLRQHLKGRVVSVRRGLAFSRMDADVFEVNPTRTEDFEALLSSLDFDPKAPLEVLYLWPVTLHRSKMVKLSFDELTELAFAGLLSLLQAAADQRLQIHLSVVTNGALSVEGERLDPEKALSLGPVRVAGREIPHVAPRLIDWGYDPIWERLRDEPILQLYDELISGCPERVIALRDGQRWVESLSDVRLPEAPGNQWFEAGATYLVTGAFGGIGRELVKEIAGLGPCHLILVGRKKLPERALWEREDLTSDMAQRILLVLDLERRGAQVTVEEADLGSEAQVRELARRCPNISGVFHAAGLLDDGPIQAKTQDAALRVIFAKAKGAFLLAEHLPLAELKFFILFSSSSSRLGLRGQVDYTAANAALDALACDLRARGFRQVVSINWGTWKDVGMAARMAQGTTFSQETALSQGTPLSQLDAENVDLAPQSSVSSDEEEGPSSERERSSWWGQLTPLGDAPADVTYTSVFSSKDDWILREHRLMGGPTVMPGTGYVELALTALHCTYPGRSFELVDVLFLRPFAVVPGESREISLHLSGSPRQGELQFLSHETEGPHVTMSYLELTSQARSPEDLVSVKSRCRTQVEIKNGFLSQEFVDFGPRWGNLKTLIHGKTEALAQVQLPDLAGRDLAYTTAHPALLDIATGGAQLLIDDFDQDTEFFVPFSYGSVKSYAPFPSAITSHVRFLGRHGQTTEFDVTITDQDGQVLMEIASFVMKKVPLAEFASAGLRPEAVAMMGTEANADFLALLSQGTTIGEGMDVIGRVLRYQPGAQIFATPVDMHAWLKHTEEAERARESASAAPTFELSKDRPRELPANSLEAELLELWSEVLGVAGLGVLDDFFELGGHSLVAARMFVRVRKKYGVSLPLSALFSAPTIRALAAEIDPDGTYQGADVASKESAPDRPKALANPVWSPIVPIQPKGTLPPFFCAPGMGGNPLGQRFLSERLGRDQPFYGLQARGVDGSQEPHSKVEDIAAEYTEAIVKVQAHGPYHLGGFSGGGVVAFEIAKQLIARGETIGLLALLDAYNPLLPASSSTYRLRAQMARSRHFGMRHVGEVLKWKVVDPLKRSGALDIIKGTNGAQGQHSFETERAALDHKMMSSWIAAERKYRPTPYSGDAVLFRSRWDLLHGRTDVLPDEKNGWDDLIHGELQVIEVPGTHDSFLLEPNVRHVAEALAKAMRRAAREARIGHASPDPDGEVAPENGPASGVSGGTRRKTLVI